MKIILMGARGLLVVGLTLGFISFLIVGIGYCVMSDSISHGEGSILVSAISWFEGDGLYHPEAYTGFPAYLAIYPPVYYGLIGIANMLTDGWSLLPGRIISFVASFGVACLIGWSIVSITRDKWAAFVSAALFFCFDPVYLWAGLHRVDSVATFFALAGVACIITNDDKKNIRILAGVCFVLAIGTKHSFIAGWLVCSAVLFLFSKRQGLSLFLGVLVSVLCSFGVLYLITDGGIWYSLVTGLTHPFSFGQFIAITKWVFETPLPILCLLIVGYGCWTGAFGKFSELIDKTKLGKRMIPPCLLAIGSAQTMLMAAKKGSSMYYYDAVVDGCYARIILR